MNKKKNHNGPKFEQENFINEKIPKDVLDIVAVDEFEEKKKGPIKGRDFHKMKT